jgi:site-specific recombinase XerD
MIIPDTLSKYREYLHFERLLAAQTIVAYTKDLNALHAWFKGHVELISRDVLREYMQHLAKSGAARATIRRKMQGMSTYFKWLEMEGIIQKIPTDNLTVPRRKRSEPKFLTLEQLEAFVNTEPPIYRFHNADRDRCAFRVLAWLGLRRAELLSLKVQDIKLTERILIVRAGKGGNDRPMPIPDKLVGDLEKVIGNRGEGWLFTSSFSPRRKWGLTSFLLAFRLHIKNCGLKCSPHMLRHSFATHLARSGVQITELADLMGHKEIKTTHQYMHSSPETLRAAIDKHPLAQGV